MSAGPHFDAEKRQVIANDLNVRRLRRDDPHFVCVLTSASHTVLYHLIDSKEWRRADVEGTLFLIKRLVNNAVTYRLVLVNRKNPNNYVDEIHSGEPRDMELVNNMIMFRDSKSDIVGIWFYVKRESELFYDHLSNILKGVHNNRDAIGGNSVRSIPTAAQNSSPANSLERFFPNLTAAEPSLNVKMPTEAEVLQSVKNGSTPVYESDVLKKIANGPPASFAATTAPTTFQPTAEIDAAIITASDAAVSDRKVSEMISAANRSITSAQPGTRNYGPGAQRGKQTGNSDSRNAQRKQTRKRASPQPSKRKPAHAKNTQKDLRNRKGQLPQSQPSPSSTLNQSTQSDIAGKKSAIKPTGTFNGYKKALLRDASPDTHVRQARPAPNMSGTNMTSEPDSATTANLKAAAQRLENLVINGDSSQSMQNSKASPKPVGTHDNGSLTSNGQVNLPLGNLNFGSFQHGTISGRERNEPSVDLPKTSALKREEQLKAEQICKALADEQRKATEERYISQGLRTSAGVHAQQFLGANLSIQKTSNQQGSRPIAISSPLQLSGVPGSSDRVVEAPRIAPGNNVSSPGNGVAGRTVPMGPQVPFGMGQIASGHIPQPHMIPPTLYAMPMSATGAMSVPPVHHTMPAQFGSPLGPKIVGRDASPPTAQQSHGRPVLNGPAGIPGLHVDTNVPSGNLPGLGSSSMGIGGIGRGSMMGPATNNNGGGIPSKPMVNVGVGAHPMRSGIPGVHMTGPSIPGHGVGGVPMPGVPMNSLPMNANVVVSPAHAHNRMMMLQHELDYWKLQMRHSLPTGTEENIGASICKATHVGSAHQEDGKLSPNGMRAFLHHVLSDEQTFDSVYKHYSKARAEM